MQGTKKTNDSHVSVFLFMQKKKTCIFYFQRKNYLCHAALLQKLRLIDKRLNKTTAMKLINVFQTILLCTLLLFIGSSCEGDEDITIAPIKETILEGDGDANTINMNQGNWRITLVTALDGSVLYDEYYNPMKLDGLGVLKGSWFTIIRNKENTLVIETKDNFENDERAFIIHLQMNGNFYKEQITIRQKPSEGYDFKSIKYTLEEGDGETIMTRRQTGMNYQNHGTGFTNAFWPYFNMREYHLYKSDDKFAFKWIRGEKIWLDKPSGIKDGNIILSVKKFLYTDVTLSSDSEMKDFKVEFYTPANKQTTVNASVGYKQLKTTYTLTITNKRTKVDKVIKGKLLQEYPYDYEMSTEVTDLPKEAK